MSQLRSLTVRMVSRFTKCVAFCSTLLCLFHRHVSAQSPDSSHPAASISGTVVDSITNQPVRSVEVRARNLTAGGQNSKPNIGSSSTDAEGHFSIDNLPAGRYFVFASQQGYVAQRISGARGRALTIGSDQHISDITIELIPGATVSGSIKDPDGKPVSGVSVEIVRFFHNVGGPQLSGVTAPSFTDSVGKYRITDVGPGQYYLLAVPPTASTPATVTAKDAKKTSAPKDEKNAKVILVPTYYPNTADVSTAAPIAIRPGSDLAGMDFTLNPSHAVTVEGKVLLAATSKPAARVQVTLINNAAVTSQHETLTDAKGVYQFEDVPSGDYTLVAGVEPTDPKTKMLWGQRPLHVGDEKTRSADLRIWPGVDLNGRIHVDEKVNVDLAHINVTLWPQGNSAVTALMPDVTGVTLRADGSFTLSDVPEGTHMLSFSPVPSGFFLKSGSSVDVLETGVTVANGQSPPLVDLELSANAAQMSGTVAGDQAPAAGAMVVLVPQGTRKGLEEFSKRTTADQTGHFTMKGITPGDYKILAFDGVDRILLSDPEFVQRFEDRGETLHVSEGDAISVNLDAIPANETSP